MAEVLKDFPTKFARTSRFLDGRVWALSVAECGGNPTSKRQVLARAAARMGLRLRTSSSPDGGLIVQAYGHDITNCGDVSSDSASVDTANASFVITRAR